MSEIFQCPADAVAVLVLAHGAGAGMRHRSLQAISDALERRGIGTLRFDFPFIRDGKKRVDPPHVAVAEIERAFTAASKRTSLPVFVGGHSFGGRMATHAAAEGRIDPRGLVLCSFPLHAAGKPGTDRASHLADVRHPMLFVSGTRDALAERDLLASVVGALPRAEIHWLETADHGYRVRRRERTSQEDVFDELAGAVRRFVDRLR
ncbi:MAG TPA: alpha/beta fold hydrolase [Gammaproteobacteria bacterium]